MPSPDKPLFTRRNFLKLCAVGGAAWYLKNNFLGGLANSNFSISPDSSRDLTTHAENLPAGALARGRIASNTEILLNNYPEGTSMTEGPFSPRNTPWAYIYPGARIVSGNGDNRLMLPVSKPDVSGKYTEIDIKYIASFDGDPIGEMPHHNNSFVGIGGNWPARQFPAVEDLGVGFIRVNRSSPYYREVLAKTRERQMKTIFTYDLDFHNRMTAANGPAEVEAKMNSELGEAINNWQPDYIQISNEPDLSHNDISPQMYAQIFAYATHAIDKISFKPKLIAASIRPWLLDGYLKELLNFQIVPWAHDIHAYQKPGAIGEVYDQTVAVLRKYPQLHSDHIIVMEWGITGTGPNRANKNLITDGLSLALSKSSPVALHQFLNNNPGDNGDFGISNLVNGKVIPESTGHLFRQFIKQTPRSSKPNDWF